eukprot:CFRG0023T1
MMGQPQLPPKKGIDYMSIVEECTSYTVPHKDMHRVHPNQGLFKERHYRAYPQSIINLHNSADAADSTRDIGLFIEINHAYFIIGHKIVLWDLESSRYTIYEECLKPIIGAALVKPKPGVFDNRCSHVLVIFTADDITLLSMYFGDPSGLKMWETPFVVSGLETSVTKVIGTDGGRIFIGTSDGRLHELVYQLNMGWFSKGICYLIDHTKSVLGSVVRTLMPRFIPGSPGIIDLQIDAERSLIYALYSNFDIQAWSFTPESTSTVRSIGKIIGTNMEKMCRTSGEDVSTFAVVSMAPTPVDLSGRPSGVDLLVITNVGARIMVSASPNPPHTDTPSHEMDEEATSAKKRVKLNSTTTQYSLELLNSDLKMPTAEMISVSAAFVGSGTLIFNTRDQTSIANGMAQPNAMFADAMAPPGAVVCIATEPLTKYDNQQKDREQYTYLIDPTVQVIDIKEIPAPEKKTLKNLGEMLPSQELYLQHYFGPRQILVLTLTGVYTLEKTRPIDYLKHRLTNNVGALRLHSANDAAMLLALMCEESLNHKVKKMAGDTFFELAASERSYHTQGLAVYLKRLVYPIMKTSLVWVADDHKSGDLLIRPLYPDEHKLVLGKLERLSEYLRSCNWPSTSRNDTKAKHYLDAVLSACIECLRLSEILYRSLSTMPIPEETELDLINVLKELSCLSIESIVESEDNHQKVKSLMAQLTYDCMSSSDQHAQNLMQSELRTQCPNFFSRSDTVAKQVLGALKNVKSAHAEEHTNSSYVREAVLPHINFFITNDVTDVSVLTELVGLLDDISRIHNCDLSTDVVRVCLNIGDKLKARSEAEVEIGVSGYGRNGFGAMSASVHSADMWSEHPGLRNNAKERQDRQICYNLILAHLGGDRPSKLLKEPLHLALQSNNNEFLTSLYDMFVRNEALHSQMVCLKPKHPRLLQTHLYDTMIACMRDISEHPDMNAEDVVVLLTRADLFCQYERQNSNHYKAAEIKSLIAGIEGNISVAQRVGFYREAVSLAKAASGRTESLEFIPETEEKISLSELQNKISVELVEKIENKRTTPARKENYRQVHRSLQAKLYTVSELYNDFAVPYGLTGICLQLMKVAGYRDHKLILGHWSNIIQTAENFPGLNLSIAELGSVFGSSEYFPWEYIIRQVHVKWPGASYDVHRMDKHLFESLHDSAKVSYLNILRTYYDMENQATTAEEQTCMRAIVADIISAMVESSTKFKNDYREQPLSREDHNWLRAVISERLDQVEADDILKVKLEDLQKKLKGLAEEGYVR